MRALTFVAAVLLITIAGLAVKGTESKSISKKDVLVRVTQGTLRGVTLKSRAGRDYFAFLGVPYALPPVGDRRFQLPLEAAPWDGTYNATEVKPDCIQKDKYNPEHVAKGSEDCLYINIYTPRNPSEGANLPVMFYVHGGGPYGSGTRYSADYFMDEDVILITVHYRLGVIGNLNLHTADARGNQGLKDQAMALRWIKNNIRQFGGDENRVTIFGNSYGSMAVTGHLVSPMTTGLFQRAVAQSGTMLISMLSGADPYTPAVELAGMMNCSGDTTAPEDILACFKTLDAGELQLASHEMQFVFSVESEFDDGNAFLPDTALNLLQAGKMHPVSTMIGATSGEGLGYALPILAIDSERKKFNDDWVTNAVATLGLQGAPDPAKIANAAKPFYIGPFNLTRADQPGFTDLFSDRMFVHPASVIATYALEANEAADSGNDVFLFYFDKQADQTYAQPALDIWGDNSTFLGAGHADELQFMFPYDPFPPIPEGHKDERFSKMLVRLWASFADTGRPTGADNGAVWEPISNPKPFRWFRIDEEPNMFISSIGLRMNYWDQYDETDIFG